MTLQIIGDNVDVYQKPRYMMADQKSRDYTGSTYMYAVKNRVHVGECIYIYICEIEHVYVPCNVILVVYFYN